MMVTNNALPTNSPPNKSLNQCVWRIKETTHTVKLINATPALAKRP